MVNLAEQAGQLTGIGQGSGGGIGTGMVFLFVLLFVVFALITGFVTFFLVRWYQYKLKIVIFQRINGQFQETARRKAKIIPLGRAGDQAIMLNKPKKILPMPEIQSGKNTYNYFISDDGEWINFSFKDFDKDRRDVGAKFLDKEMRYARTSLESLGDERYSEKINWTQVVQIIGLVIFVLVVGVSFYLIADGMADVSKTNAQAIETSQDVLKEVNRILGTIDNIQEGGSGIKQGSQTLNPSS